MRFHELYARGGVTFRSAHDEPVREEPCFVFETRDLPRTRSFLRGMYVDLSLRLDTRGTLAYCLDVPDRDVEPWLIPLTSDDLRRIVRLTWWGAKGYSVVIRDPAGEEIDLNGFALDLDWSGRLARGLCELQSGNLGRAMALFGEVAAESVRGVPASHHLLGRCHRLRDELTEAIACYRVAVRNARAPLSDRLLPYAAGPLSDMGVAFKRLGHPDRAIHCFLHSLSLRPNHPEALLSFFSLLSSDETLVLFGAARVMAIGGRDQMVAEYLANYAAFSKGNPEALLAEATRLSLKMDLEVWPFRRDELALLNHFERGLEAMEKEAPEAKLDRADGARVRQEPRRARWRK